VHGFLKKPCSQMLLGMSFVVTFFLEKAVAGGAIAHPAEKSAVIMGLLAPLTGEANDISTHFRGAPFAAANRSGCASDEPRFL
jgi:hypothetical protein